MAARSVKATIDVDAGTQHSLFAAWRTQPPNECMETDVFNDLNELAEILTSMCRARSCDAEIAGSVSHAIGGALNALKRPSASEAAVDLSMSLVLRHALRGDPTARVLILFALKRTHASVDLVEGWRRWRPEDRQIATAGLVDRSADNALQ